MKYKIFKNWHYSWPMFTKISNIKKEHIYNVKFSSIVHFTDVSEKKSVNKLFGWSNGFCNHHKNSFRIGWRCVQNKIYLYDYRYIDGKLFKSQLCKVPNEINIVLQETKNDTNKNYKQINIYNSTWIPIDSYRIYNIKKYGFWLSPFFGGNTPSPKTIWIKIKKIKKS